MEGLLHELKQWLLNNEGGSFNEDWLNSLQHVEELNPSPDELALAEQLLQQIKELLENAALPGQSGKTADAIEAVPADESGTEEPKNQPFCSRLCLKSGEKFRRLFQYFCDL